MNILPHTPHHAVPGGRVDLLGACRTVTGAMTRVELGGRAVLVDCGEPQGRDADGWQFPERARDAEALVLTHGHLDHVSAVPRLLERFDGPIFGTPASLEIAQLNLVNSLGLAREPEERIAALRRRFRAQARPLDYGAPADVAGLRLELHEAGHILGSSSVELESDAARVICSGDLGRPGSPLLRDYHLAYRGHRPIDLVVLETTYGDRDHRRGPADILDDLERIITHALKDGGHILIPSFAIGRTQALLYYLNALVESGRLDDIPVAVDTPLGLRITETYARHQALFDRQAQALLARGDDPLDFEGLYAVTRGRDSRRLPGVEQPLILIAGSGMCTGGRIVGHLLELLPDPTTCVLFVGYQAHGTPGRAIQEAAKRRGATVELAGQRVAVRADVQTLSGLSAHADREELAAWVHAMPQVNAVALHHGEVAVQERFGAWLGRRRRSRDGA
jgi:metallo-beta-lactamase family protein